MLYWTFHVWERVQTQGADSGHEPERGICALCDITDGDRVLTHSF